MPAVALDEQVDCTNPLVQFGYQSGGQLLDVEELMVSIIDLTDGTTKLAETAVDLADCPTGHRLGPGRYVAEFLPDAATWTPGTHEARWRYRLEPAGAWRQSRQRFELLEPGVLASGAAYQGYGDTHLLLRQDAYKCYDLADLQRVLHETGQLVHDLTGRMFSPRFLATTYNGEFQGALPLDLPIIGLSKVAFLGSAPADEVGVVDLDDLRIYNRHLAGLTSPDDRQNPRIEFATDQQPGRVVAQGAFERGRLNILIEGLFGYTEWDGSPLGATPARLQKAVYMLALRTLQDPTGADVFAQQPGRVRSAETRDQKITFATASEGGMGALTGDRLIDDILITYLRPPTYEAVGPSRALHDRTTYRGTM